MSPAASGAAGASWYRDGVSEGRSKRDGERPADGEGGGEVLRGEDGELVPRPKGERVDEPPVVARLMVEIRSDGSQTIARGALEDMNTGQSVGVEARGETPLGMAFSLARTITRGPAFARTAARSMRQSIEAQSEPAAQEPRRRGSLARRVARRARRMLQRR